MEFTPLIIIIIAVFWMLIRLKPKVPKNATLFRYVISSKGRRGELHVAAILEKMPPEFSVFNDVYLRHNGHSVQIDHVVVSPYGILVIETKNYSGRIYGFENSEQWTQTFYREKHRFYNPLKQNHSHILALSKTLNLDEKYFRNIVVFTGSANLMNELGRLNNVVYINELEDRLLSYPQVFHNPSTLTDIATRLENTRITDPDRAERHIQSVKNRTNYNQNVASQGLCPRCHRKLVWRQGRYGGFCGCSGYPMCRFTKKR